MNEIINFGSGAKVKVMMLKGEAGNDIQNLSKTSTEGLVDTYTITLTDGTTHTFEVTNGRAILSIEKTSSQGYVDTYTITFNDGTTMDVQFEKATITVDDALSDTSTNPVQNKVITKEVVSLNGRTRTNLLNPTLPTKTENGITLTNNGDGTYTLTGTATSDVFFDQNDGSQFFTPPKGTYRYCGTPKNGSTTTYKSGLITDKGRNNDEFGNGIDITFDGTTTCLFRIVVYKNTTFPSGGLVFKPMLTSDLFATYDDFVRYSGAGELNENVADIYEDLKDAEADILANRSNFATIENGSTASQSYSVGAFMVHGGKLCKVTSAVAQGDTWAEGTNYQIDSVGAELSQINADLSDTMPKDAIKYHYQPNIRTASDGLFVLDAIQDYVPIACYMIFPTGSAQRHIEINYNPANGVYYGQTSANLGIEVTTIYLKYIP